MERVSLAESTPLSENDLTQWETHAGENETLRADDVLRLIAEVRRLQHRVGPPAIVHDPERCGGDPTIRGTRIGVADVAALAPRYDGDLDRLRAVEFPDLSPAEVEAAMEYYQTHKEEIEAILRRDQELFERLPPAPVRK
jgi:uncharacterized protein (DUF433 family)